MTINYMYVCVYICVYHIHTYMYNNCCCRRRRCCWHLLITDPFFLFLFFLFFLFFELFRWLESVWVAWRWSRARSICVVFGWKEGQILHARTKFATMRSWIGSTRTFRIFLFTVLSLVQDTRGTMCHICMREATNEKDWNMYKLPCRVCLFTVNCIHKCSTHLTFSLQYMWRTPVYTCVVPVPQYHLFEFEEGPFDELMIFGTCTRPRKLLLASSEWNVSCTSQSTLKDARPPRFFCAYLHACNNMYVYSGYEY